MSKDNFTPRPTSGTFQEMEEYRRQKKRDEELLRAQKETARAQEKTVEVIRQDQERQANQFEREHKRKREEQMAAQEDARARRQYEQDTLRHLKEEKEQRGEEKKQQAEREKRKAGILLAIANIEDKYRSIVSEFNSFPVNAAAQLEDEWNRIDAAETGDLDTGEDIRRLVRCKNMIGQYSSAHELSKRRTKLIRKIYAMTKVSGKLNISLDWKIADCKTAIDEPLIEKSEDTEIIHQINIVLASLAPLCQAISIDINTEFAGIQEETNLQEKYPLKNSRKLDNLQKSKSARFGLSSFRDLLRSFFWPAQNTHIQSLPKTDEISQKSLLASSVRLEAYFSADPLLSNKTRDEQIRYINKYVAAINTDFMIVKKLLPKIDTTFASLKPFNEKNMQIMPQETAANLENMESSIYTMISALKNNDTGMLVESVPCGLQTVKSEAILVRDKTIAVLRCVQKHIEYAEKETSVEKICQQQLDVHDINKINEDKTTRLVELQAILPVLNELINNWIWMPSENMHSDCGHEIDRILQDLSEIKNDTDSPKNISRIIEQIKSVIQRESDSQSEWKASLD